MGVEFISEKYRDVVVLPGGFQLISVEASSPEALDQELGDKLSEYTYEQGGSVPKGTVVDRSKITKIGSLSVRKIAIGERVLVP